MGARVTIVLNDTNAERLRNLQAKMIKSSSKSVTVFEQPESIITFLTSPGITRSFGKASRAWSISSRVLVLSLSVANIP